MHHRSIYFYLFVISAFLIVIVPDLLSDGMFMDGTIYATVSHNLANGVGTFWEPQFSATFMTPFYEHPLLAIWLQSACFYLFGDSILVERFYAIVILVVSAFLLLRIWIEIGQSKRTGWLPLLFWFSISKVSWSFSNNMLEITMGVFVLFAVLFVLKSRKDKYVLFTVIAGLMLTLALLTKGFVCLYVWMLPFYLWLVFRERTFFQMSFQTLLLMIATSLPILLLYLFSDGASNHFTHYIQKQVVGSIENVETVSNRFAILWEFLQHIIFPLSLILISWIVAKVKRLSFSEFGTHQKYVTVFLLLVFSGILPIMISLKQSGFYLITVYPLLGIAFALMVLPILLSIWKRYPPSSNLWNLFKTFSVICGIGCIIVSVIFTGKDRRDIDTIHDVKKIIAFTGQHATIHSSSSFAQNWDIQAYLYRLGYVSLNGKLENCGYAVSLESITSDTLTNYIEIDLDLKSFHFYRCEHLIDSRK